ncbi:uncharacterized protein LOC100037121 isoform X1 [Xenopus laevis]|uniref:Calcium homeostasis modulator protein 6 n=2 Tax=Xenopus laevis TaxID=8355 RepID=A0A974HJI4_XENLA|nr:uncharacterized protein LOC100037121 isoform X1 [Xenopus laevis]OCT80329.1 hypothetical protein XELAEV_18027149mg [Xenopus laevis]
MEYFKTVLNLGVKHQSVIGYGALSLLAAVGENVFSTVLFECPCNSWNYIYGMVFLLVPAVILFFLGHMLNFPLWKHMTGCCNSEKPRHHVCRRWVLFFRVFWQMTFVSALAPLIWIALALLNGTFYVCIVSGLKLEHVCDHKEKCIKELPHIPCPKLITSNLSRAEITQVASFMRAESQILGWTVLGCVLIVVVLSTCIRRCISPVSYLQLKFWKMYIEREQELFDVKCKEHATKLAERNISIFFDHTKVEQFETPKNNDWNQVSSAYIFNKKTQFYSMLHRFVEYPDRKKSLISLEGDMVSPAEMPMVDMIDGFES